MAWENNKGLEKDLSKKTSSIAYDVKAPEKILGQASLNSLFC